MIQRTQMSLAFGVYHVGDPERTHGACEMYVHARGEYSQVFMECTEFYDGTLLVRTPESVDRAFDSCIDGYDAHHVSMVTWCSSGTIPGLEDCGVAALQASPEDPDHTQWFTLDDAFDRAERCAGLLALCRLFGRMGRAHTTRHHLLAECGAA